MQRTLEALALLLGLFEATRVGVDADQPGQIEQGDVVPDLQRQNDGDRVRIRARLNPLLQLTAAPEYLLEGAALSLALGSGVGRWPETVSRSSVYIDIGDPVRSCRSHAISEPTGGSCSFLVRSHRPFGTREIMRQPTRLCAGPEVTMARHASPGGPSALPATPSRADNSLS